jgi:hypothetical protein
MSGHGRQGLYVGGCYLDSSEVVAIEVMHRDAEKIFSLRRSTDLLAGPGRHLNKRNMVSPEQWHDSNTKYQ